MQTKIVPTNYDGKQTKELTFITQLEVELEKSLTLRDAARERRNCAALEEKRLELDIRRLRNFISLRTGNPLMIKENTRITANTSLQYRVEQFLVTNSDEDYRICTIAFALGEKIKPVYQALDRLKRNGRIISVGWGRYQVVVPSRDSKAEGK
jgi:predicted Rossmann fold nucleotide-binding protein DprA/Smf involved in DNA uptake